MECAVERIEGHDHKADDKGAFEKGEEHSQQLVHPAQHHDLQHAFQKFSESGQSGYDADKYQSEGHQLQDFSRSFYVLGEPSAHGLGELEGEEDSQNKGNYSYHLGYEAFSEALNERRYEAYENYDIQYVH